jgi:predicted aspartyl protease
MALGGRGDRLAGARIELDDKDPTAARRNARRPAIELPPGAISCGFESVEGIIFVEATLHGPSGVDTTGLFVLDTGAGFLGVEPDVALRLGLTSTARDSQAIALTQRPLSRLEIGGLQIDQVSPVMSVRLEIIGRVTGRPVLGLLGQRLFSGRALLIDQQRRQLVVIPAAIPGLLGSGSAQSGESTGSAGGRPGASSPTAEASRAVFGSLISARAVALPFRLEGDGKILVRARFANPQAPRFSPWLNLVFDTGATKCILFDPAFDDSVPGAEDWRSFSGLAAPTLLGRDAARVTLAPEIQLAADTSSTRAAQTAGVSKKNVDCAVVESPLAMALTSSVGEPVHGLLGYSFLKYFRLGIDYVRQVVWLDPYDNDWDARPYEYSHVGLQVEREEDVLRVVAVVTNSPAARAGIQEGDELISVDGRTVRGGDLASVLRQLEGPPGTRVSLTTRRSGLVRTQTLVRQRLL